MVRLAGRRDGLGDSKAINRKTNCKFLHYFFLLLFLNGVRSTSYSVRGWAVYLLTIVHLDSFHLEGPLGLWGLVV